MKLFKTFLPFLFAFICGITPAHSQDYIDNIAVEACNCVDQLSDTIDREEYLMSLGTCMINAALPYKKKLKADYGINLDNIDEKAGEQLGKIVGLRMANKCPKSLLKITRMDNEDTQNETTSPQSPDSKTFTGTVTAVENESFVVFSIKDDLGKTARFFWLNFVQCDSDLVAHYTSLVGSTVKIQYSSSEFFDPKINEYRQFNIIQSVNIFK